MMQDILSEFKNWDDEETLSLNKSIGLLESLFLDDKISEDVFEKARTGKYADTPENRRLKRVGQTYGSKKEEEQGEDKQKKDEDTKTDKPSSIEDQAKQASQTALENAAKGGNEELRVAAHKELQRREQEEKPKENKEEAGKEGEINPIDEVNSKIEEELNKNSNDVYKYEKIKGGLSDNMTIETIAKKHDTPLNKILKEYSRGIEVEMEHTDDEEKASEIARDHLFEIPDYYTRLDKMEKQAKND